MGQDTTSAGPVVITVAIAGTPAAATADFVCDGTNDQVEINAAIQQAGMNGGGIVSIAAGTYSTSGNVNVGYDNITIQGAGAGATIIQTTPDMPFGSGIAFFNDNFECRDLTVDVSRTLSNGISMIACENGIVADCEVFTYPGHTYGIWVLESHSIQVLDNYVSGGPSLAEGHPDQEGIEVSGSSSPRYCSGQHRESYWWSGSVYIQLGNIKRYITMLWIPVSAP